MCLGSPITQTSTLVGMSTWPASSFCLCGFWQAVRCLWSLNMSGIPNHTDLHPDRNVYHGPYKCLGSSITWTSTVIGMSTWSDGSFCLCFFWQAVRHLWSVHVSGIPHHTDLRPCRNGYLTNWLILPVLFLTGGETSVVPTRVRNPPSPRPLLQ